MHFKHVLSTTSSTLGRAAGREEAGRGEAGLSGARISPFATFRDPNGPRHLLMESVLWSLRSKQSYQDLVDTIWKMFPEKSVHAEVFRLCLYCSVADIEMAYTDSGWPTNKKVTQPPATAYAERPTAFVGVPQAHADPLTYINN